MEEYKTFIYGYNNTIQFTIKANNENDAYVRLTDILEILQWEYACIMPDVNCFDLVAAY